MAGLFDTTNDAVAQVMAQRQKANQALGSPYGKYGGIVQAGGMFADTMADAIAGGGYGSSDPAAQKSIELKKIYTVVAQQFPGKTNTPDFYKALALAIGDKYQDKSQEAMDKARQIEQEQAEAALNKKKTEAQMSLWAAQEKKALQPPKGSELSQLLSEMQTIQASNPNDPRLKYYEDKLKGDKDKVNYGVDRNALAKTMFNVSDFGKLSQQQADKVEEKYQIDLTKRARASVPNAPKNVSDQFNGFDTATKDDNAMYKTTKSAYTLVTEAEKSNNATAWEGARTQITKAIGESKLSNEDIRRMGGDPNLVKGALDWVNKRITASVPTQDTINQLKQVIVLVNNQAAKNINEQSDRFSSALAFDYAAPQEKLDLWFPKKKGLPPVTIGGSKPTPPGGASPSGSPKAVSWNNLPKGPTDR